MLKDKNPMFKRKHTEKTKLLMVAAKSKPVYVYSNLNEIKNLSK